MFGIFKKRNSGNPIEHIATHLRVMGYDLTHYGAVVALLEFESGYNEVETASHIAYTTMALDIREAGYDIRLLMQFVSHAWSLLEILKEYKDKKMINPTQWQNDTTAIYHISAIDSQQEEWIEKILSDPISGKERLANSRIDYDSLRAQNT